MSGGLRRRNDNVLTSGDDETDTSPLVPESHGKSNGGGGHDSSSRTNTTTTKDDIDDLSWTRVAIAFLPLLALTAAAIYSGSLGHLPEDALVASLRTFVQLSFLAALLTPIFASESHSRLFTLSYVFLFMLPLAAYESTARPPLTHRGAYPATLSGLFIGVATSVTVAVVLVVRPRPRHSPRVVIPLSGMLISNALSGLALASSELLDQLRNRSERIDVLLAMGASPLEAAWGAVTSALTKSLVPTLSSMNVIGLVAIPGMMTGQILSGGSPGRAARYQMVIMYLVAAANWLSATVMVGVTMGQVFDARGVFMGHTIVDNATPRVSQVVSDVILHFRVPGENVGSDVMKTAEEDAMMTELAPIELRSEYVASDVSEPLLDLDVVGTLALGRNFRASLTLGRGEISCLLGPSGIGKSTFFRAIAELSSAGAIDGTSSTIRLNGIRRESFPPSEWRRRVMYLPQMTASSLTGTPIDLIKDVHSLKIRKGGLGATVNGVNAVLELIQKWNVRDAEVAIRREWSDLSGGEAQRILLAIAFTSDSEVLLLDEPTSALDEVTKGKVEESLRSLGKAVFMVTHDEDQPNRLGASRLRLLPMGETLSQSP